MSTKKAEFFEFHFLLLVPSGSTPLKRPSRLWPQFHPSHLIRFSTSAHSLFLDWLHWPKSGTGEKVIWGCASRPAGWTASIIWGEIYSRVDRRSRESFLLALLKSIYRPSASVRRPPDFPVGFPVKESAFLPSILSSSSALVDPL